MRAYKITPPVPAGSSDSLIFNANILNNLLINKASVSAGSSQQLLNTCERKAFYNACIALTKHQMCPTGTSKTDRSTQHENFQ